jgi:hypothetical protein
MARAYDISKYVDMPSTGVVVDKIYLMDVLKRLSLSSEPANIRIEVLDGLGTMKVASKNMTQSIPVFNVKGSGTFSFQIKAELLSNVIFSHMTVFSESVFIYLEQVDNNRIIMGVNDNTKLWQTKLSGLTAAKDDFAWS